MFERVGDVNGAGGGVWSGGEIAVIGEVVSDRVGEKAAVTWDPVNDDGDEGKGEGVYLSFDVFNC